MPNNRMLFMCSYAAPYGGNFIPSLIALEERLNSFGIKCVYCFPCEAQCRPWVAQMINSGKDIVFINFKISRTHFYRELERLVSTKQISYIYTHFCSFLPFEFLSLLHREIKVFIHIHSDFSAEKASKSIKEKFQNYIFYTVLSKRVHFFSVSPKFVDYNPRKISFVPNGLAKDRVFCNHVSGSVLRDKYNISETEILCEIFGWSPYVKGVDVAVNAVKKLNEQYHISVKLAIICGINVNPEKMKQWVSNNTECSGCESYLLYWKPTEDVFSYHEASNILLSSSRSEGFSYAVLEKLSLGGQCVVSDIPGLTWAKKYETVHNFPSEDVNAFVDCIRKAIASGCQPNTTVAQAIQNSYAIDVWTETIAEKMNIKV